MDATKSVEMIGTRWMQLKSGHDQCENMTSDSTPPSCSSHHRVANNLKSEIARTVSGSDSPHAEIIFHQRGNIRDVGGIVGRQVKSPFDKIDTGAEIHLSRADDPFDRTMRASRNQHDSLLRLQRLRYCRKAGR